MRDAVTDMDSARSRVGLGTLDTICGHDVVAAQSWHTRPRLSPVGGEGALWKRRCRRDYALRMAALAFSRVRYIRMRRRLRRRERFGTRRYGGGCDYRMDWQAWADMWCLQNNDEPPVVAVTQATAPRAHDRGSAPTRLPRALPLAWEVIRRGW